jgi:hypothetical protein
MIVSGDASLRIGLAVVICAGGALTSCSPDHATAPQVQTRARVLNGLTSRAMTQDEVRRFIEKHGSQRARDALRAPRPALTEGEDPPGDARLFVFSSSWVENFSADVAGGAAVSAGQAAVQAVGSSELQQGHYISNHYDDEGCYGWNNCSYGAHWPVNCQEDDWSIHNSTYGQALWNNAHSEATATSGHKCLWEGSPGGPDNGPDGAGSDCDVYIVERSDDGGQSWYVTDSWSECH